nr:hypothetical protein [Tanacetum cinerariifolium]
MKYYQVCSSISVMMMLYGGYNAVLQIDNLEDKWGGLSHALRNSLKISKYAPSTSRAVTSMSRLDISTSYVDDDENGILTASFGMKGKAVGLLLLQMQECGNLIKAADNIVENNISGEEIKLEELETRMWTFWHTSREAEGPKFVLYGILQLNCSYTLGIARYFHKVLLLDNEIAFNDLAVLIHKQVLTLRKHQKLKEPTLPWSNDDCSDVENDGKNTEQFTRCKFS